MTTSNNEADGFSVAERSGNNLIVGKMLKFTIDSKYKIDKADILPDNTTLVAVDVTTAWVKWQNDKPIEHRITQPGQGHPDRDDLPDQDKATWEPGLNGEPAFPWRDTRYLRLIDPRTGTSGTMTVSVRPWRPASCSGTALLTGYFGSTGLARRISTKSAPCSRPDYERTMLVVADPPYHKGRPDRQPFRSIDHAARRRQALREDYSRQKRVFELRQGEKAVAFVSQGLGRWCADFIPDDFDNTGAQSLGRSDPSRTSNEKKKPAATP